MPRSLAALFGCLCLCVSTLSWAAPLSVAAFGQTPAMESRKWNRSLPHICRAAELEGRRGPPARAPTAIFTTSQPDCPTVFVTNSS